MKRRLCPLAGVAAAVLLLAASAAATPAGSSRAGASDATPAAAPFSEAWANVPRTAAARQAKDILVFGQEQEINGFNTYVSCCNQFWGFVLSGAVIRQPLPYDNKLRIVNDLVSSATANAKSLTFNIRKEAVWNWGGKKLPVTYRDFVYTWKQFINPNNDVVTRAGFEQINRYTHKGDRQVTFYWKPCPAGGTTPQNPCGPYADWRDIFGQIFPSAALAGMDFNKIWANCICGNDGKPISDGPFILTNYTKGQGSRLVRNPFWWGHKQGLKEIDFKLIADTNTEVQAMRGGEVDAINPTFGQNLLPLKNASGITFNQVAGLYQEHLDIQFGPKGQPLLRAPWFRQALMMAIDRRALIKTVYGDLAGNTKPLNSIIYWSTDSHYKDDFAQWDYNPNKALALMKKHCTGGPSKVSQSNSAIWTCSGYPAKIRDSYTSGNQVRTTSEAIFAAELKSIGIELENVPLAANVIFGPTGLPGGDTDLSEYAHVASTPDPGVWKEIFACDGQANWGHYCSRLATRLMTSADSNLDPEKRLALYEKADQLMARAVPIIPLYQRPNALIYKSQIRGMENSNNPTSEGPTWNAEYWGWK
jgi:peptide/nickel transport system substrate-binding protein